MSKHTPEPWEFESEPQYCSEIIGSNGYSVCAFVDDPSGVDIDRMLACVNACAGMADPAAEIAELKRQRDELLAALNKYEEAFDGLFGHCGSNGVFNHCGRRIDCTTLNEAHELSINATKGSAS